MGDGLYTQPVIEDWLAAHPGWEIDLLTYPDYIAEIYTRFGLPLRVITNDDERNPPYDLEFEFDASASFKLCDQHRIHISQGYAMMLGVEPFTPRRVKFECSDEDDHEKDLILLSMHSHSCLSQFTPPRPATTMISYLHWLPIVTLLRQYGKIGVLGGAQHRPPLPLTEDELFLGVPLEKTARMLRDAKLLVTVGNGMSHLGATQLTPTILFYQQILGLYYIVPSGNPNLYVRQMDPTKISIADALMFVRQAVKHLLKT